MRVAALIALGLVFTTGLGLAGHLIARDTVALPVASIEAGEGLAPARVADRPTTAGTTTRAATTTRSTRTATTTETDDRGRGRGNGRGRGRDDNSGSGSSGSGSSGSSGSGGGEDD
jgi:uncharacterized membrane protein YgcG